MKKVKIVLMEELSDDDYCRTIIRAGLTDWEEISDEDFEFLRMNLYRAFGKRLPWGMHPRLIVEDEPSIVDRIGNIKTAIAEEKKRLEKEKKVAADKKKEREAKKREKELKRLASSEEEERKLLESLKEKYEK